LKNIVVEFDEEIGKQIYQEPLDKEEKHVAARKSLEKVICDALENKANTRSDAPLFQVLLIAYGEEK
jgi:hypothetical protein